MKVEIGGKGLENSWQAPFPENTACVHGCGGVAIPAVCLMERDKRDAGKHHPHEHTRRQSGADPGEGNYICNLPVAGAVEDSSKMLWPHDLTAFAIYLCPKCLEPTALFNQA